MIEGEFIRTESRFRDWVTASGGAEHSGHGDFPAAPGRYHLYVSYACPWAHRTLIYRVLKGLEDVISVSVVHPVMPPESWVFGEYPGATPDHVHRFDKLGQIYELAEPDYDGLVSVPVLYDKHRSTIVNIHKVTGMRAHINGEYFLTLEGGNTVKLSRTYKDKLKLFS